MSASRPRRFVVEYSLPYLHCVQVGVEARDQVEAIAIAERLFDSGELWDDTEVLPLLYDDYEESDDGTALTFRVAAEVAQWPQPAACVKELRRREGAFDAAWKLVEAYRRRKHGGRSVDWEDVDLAYEAALRAVGGHEAARKELRGKEEQ